MHPLRQGTVKSIVCHDSARRYLHFVIISHLASILNHVLTARHSSFTRQLRATILYPLYRLLAVEAASSPRPVQK